MNTLKPLALWMTVALLGLHLAACDNGSAGGGEDNPDAFGDSYAVTTARRLISFNLDTRELRSAVTISGLQAQETILAIDVRPGGATPRQLLALGSSGRLYAIDRASGAATLKTTLTDDPADAGSFSLPLPAGQYGIDFNPLVDRLRIVSERGDNWRVNADTGATLIDGALKVDAAPISGVSGAAYTHNFATACRTQLFYIDTARDRLLTTASPNTGDATVVGALGVDAEAVNGFDILTAIDDTRQTGFALLTVGGSARLYEIALDSGAASERGPIAGLQADERITGMALRVASAAPAQALGELIGVTESNRLVSFNRNSPGRLCSSTAVNGLAAGVNILGIDARPKDDTLYGLGSNGSILLLDAAGGGSSVVLPRLTSSAAGTPVVALSGTAFGLDFNPALDRLRIISNTGQNLAVNLEAEGGAGNTSVDTALDTANLSGAGYSNNVRDAASTQLFYIDSAGAALRTTAAPASGATTLVGVLNQDVGALNGFDIRSSGASQSAVLAAESAGVGGSVIYSVDLASGAATVSNNSVAASTVAGGERLRGLSFRR